MTDEEKAIRPCEFFSICEAACGGTLEDIEICSCYEIFKQLKRKEQECEEINLTNERLVAEKYNLNQILQDLIEQMKNDIEIYGDSIHDNRDFICTIRNYLRMVGDNDR